MLQFLKTHKRPMSLIIKETYFTLNIFFIATIVLSTCIYFYLLSNTNQINYKRVKLTLSQKNLISEYQMLQSKLLDNSSLTSSSQDIFEKLNLEKPQEIIFIKPRKISLEK